LDTQNHPFTARPDRVERPRFSPDTRSHRRFRESKVTAFLLDQTDDTGLLIRAG